MIAFLNNLNAVHHVLLVNSVKSSDQATIHSEISSIPTQNASGHWEVSVEQTEGGEVGKTSVPLLLEGRSAENRALKL
jgi:hypothetical protein